MECFFLVLIPFVVAIFLVNSEEYIKILGLLTGFVLGYIVEDKFIQFETGQSNKRIDFSSKSKKTRKNKSRIIINSYRFIIGILTLALAYVGLKYIMPSSYIFDYIRYTIVVFYAVAGVPAIFKMLNLN
ncbi:hypothetical protein [[Clostridium] dakarense]|uniref:hypothetical protein n=1 Tax=Faecalimicrobium dakarense TaxID=1301100 RepID=UPI001FA6C9CB|nr:hypothetical protein [[Clostridium] dakarense]